MLVRNVFFFMLLYWHPHISGGLQLSPHIVQENDDLSCARTLKSLADATPRHKVVQHRRLYNKPPQPNLPFPIQRLTDKIIIKSYQIIRKYAAKEKESIFFSPVHCSVQWTRAGDGAKPAIQVPCPWGRGVVAGGAGGGGLHSGGRGGGWAGGGEGQEAVVGLVGGETDWN